jgi:hypothetical protein
MRLFRLLLGFALLVHPLAAAGDPITLVASTRSVAVDAVLGTRSADPGVIYNQPAMTNTITLTGGEGAATASAALISQVAPSDGVFSGSGGTAASHQTQTVNGGGHAQADYGVLFDLTAAQQFDFSAAFATIGGEAGTRSLWAVELTYYPGPTANPVFTVGGTDTRDLWSTGLLQPGRYGLFLQTVSDAFGTGAGGTSAHFSFSLTLADPQLAPTPEPGSMLLLGSGLLGLLARSRMRNRQT